MKALILSQENEKKIAFKESPKPVPQKGEVLVRILAAALNRRDQWMREEKYPKLLYGAIMGSDACGIVEEVGDSADQHWLGKTVILNPNNEWGENPDVQSSSYHILGMPSDGTFAEYIVRNSDKLAEKPAFLTPTQAAAIPLAGLTAFRAIFHHGKVQENTKVLITGIGGGVATFAFQFALAVGAEVYVSSGSETKLQKAQEMGAKGGFNYKNADWTKKMQEVGGFDVVIDSAGGEAINHFIRLLKPAGKIVFYGASTGLPEKIDLYRMFFKQIGLQGSTMGNDTEFLEMIKFIEKHQIEPIIDAVFGFEHIFDAFDALKNGNQLGKLVIEL